MRLLTMFVGTIIGIHAACAAEPTGDWRDQDGAGIVRIDICNGALWGIIASDKGSQRDVNNPNPALRNRPVLGMPILINMKPAGRAAWKGEIYNPQNGKTYTSTVTLKGENTLRVEGCVFGGLLCGGQNWTRVASAPHTTGRGKGAASDVCARVSR